MPGADPEPLQSYSKRRSFCHLLLFAVVAAGVYAYVSNAPPRESRPIRLLLAIDLSVSMNCPVEELDPPCLGAPPPRNEHEADGKRIAAAVDGATDGLAWFGPRDSLAIWTFSGNSVVDQVTQQTFSGKSNDPDPSGDFPSFHKATAKGRLRHLLTNARGAGTPLNLAIYFGVRALRADWQPGINVLVILTDGGDFKSSLNAIRLDKARLDRLLSKGPQPPVHVLLTTAGYGVQCGKLLMEDITAFAYDAKDDCFAVSFGSDAPTTFKRVGARLRELAQGR